MAAAVAAASVAAEAGPASGMSTFCAESKCLLSWSVHSAKILVFMGYTHLTLTLILWILSHNRGTVFSYILDATFFVTDSCWCPHFAYCLKWQEKLCKIIKQEWKSEGKRNKHIGSFSQNTNERTWTSIPKFKNKKNQKLWQNRKRSWLLSTQPITNSLCYWKQAHSPQ